MRHIYNVIVFGLYYHLYIHTLSKFFRQQNRSTWDHTKSYKLPLPSQLDVASIQHGNTYTYDIHTSKSHTPLPYIWYNIDGFCGPNARADDCRPNQTRPAAATAAAGIVVRKYARLARVDLRVWYTCLANELAYSRIVLYTKRWECYAHARGSCVTGVCDAPANCLNWNVNIFPWGFLKHPQPGLPLDGEGDPEKGYASVLDTCDIFYGYCRCVCSWVVFRKVTYHMVLIWYATEIRYVTIFPIQITPYGLACVPFACARGL